MLKVFNIFFYICLFTTNCKGQNDIDFYNKEKAYITWKESILDQIDSLTPLYGNDLHNFFVGACQIRFSAFCAMVDTLGKYDNGKMSQYYIVYNYYVREGDGQELSIRMFNNTGMGYEVRSYGKNKFKKIVSKPYSFDEKLFEQINNEMIMNKNHTFNVFSISIFKSGRFETKIYSVNNPDDSKVLHRFLPYIGGW